MNRQSMDALGLSLVTLIAAFFITTPYLFPSFLLPRTEELSYSLYPLIVWSKQMMGLHVPQWFGAAGLGIPWPVPHTMSHTPFLPLFAYLPVYTAVGIMVMVYIAFQGFYVVKLCRHFEVSRLLTYVALITVLLASPIEFLERFDATAVFLTWTLLPAIIYYLLQILSPSQKTSQLLFSSLMLGIVVGYAILNTHIGMFLSDIVGMAVIALIFWKQALRRIPFFVLGALITLGIGAEKLIMLANELPLFSQGLFHQKDSWDKSFLFSVWSLFLKPIAIEGITPPPFNLMSRCITFGCPVFGIIIVLACLRWRTMRAWPEAGRMVLIFLSLFLLSFTPASYLPMAFSASWNLREPAILIGIIIIAKYCDIILRPKLRPSLYNPLLLLQLVGVIVSGYFFVYSTEPTYAPASYPTQIYNTISDSSAETPVNKLLDQAMSCNGLTAAQCNALGKRYVMSSQAMYAAQSKYQVKNGLIINNTIVHGFENVSYLAKGISLDSIQRSQSIPYGLISGEGFIFYGYRAGYPEWTMQDQALLNILGIRAIIGPADNAAPNLPLHKTGDLPPQDNVPSGLAVYANWTAFPRAFFVDPNVLNWAKIKPHCGKSTYLVCQDLSDVVKTIMPWQDPIQFEEHNDMMVLHMTPAPYPRTALVSVMWRPEWSGMAGSIPVAITNQWGLMKISVPENQNQVTLTYYSIRQTLGRWITLLTLLFSIGGCIALRRLSKSIKKAKKNGR